MGSNIVEMAEKQCKQDANNEEMRVIITGSFQPNVIWKISSQCMLTLICSFICISLSFILHCLHRICVSQLFGIKYGCCDRGICASDLRQGGCLLVHRYFIVTVLISPSIISIFHVICMCIYTCFLPGDLGRFEYPRGKPQPGPFLYTATVPCDTDEVRK